MLKKQFFKTKDTCKVTFSLPPEQLPEGVEIEKISVVGDFNDWDPEATPLRLLKSGVWKEKIELAGDSEYKFRYKINGNMWHNDPDADGYVPNDFDEENCIVTTHRPS